LLIHDNVLSLNSQLAAERHCVAGIYGKVQEYLLELTRIRFYAVKRIPEPKTELNIFANKAAQELTHLGDEFVHVHNFGLDHLHPAESKELAGKGSSTASSFANLLRVMEKGITGLEAIEEQFAVTGDYGKEVVKVVGNAPCQPPQRVHLLSLAELAFKLFALLFIPLKSAAHAVKRPCQLGEFIVATRFKGIGKVASLECLNSLHQGCEGARNSIGDEKNQGTSREGAQQPES
jgi:hypothetical protein